MASRPSILEEEEDLLKMQREFLAKKQAQQVPKDVVNLQQGEEPDKPPGIQRKRRFERAPLKDDKDVFQSMDARDGDLVSVLTDITEMSISNKPIVVPVSNSRGFPCANDFKLTSEKDGKSRKSLFAQQYDKKYNFKCKAKPKVAESPLLKNVSPKDKSGIEKEVDEILDKMTEDEKREEANNLLKTIEPKLLAFLKQKKDEAAGATQEMDVDSPVETSSVVVDFKPSSSDQMMEVVPSAAPDRYLNPEKQNVDIDGCQVELPVYFKVGEHHNMDSLEASKMQWMSDLPSVKSVKNGPSEARFDFDGKVIPLGTDVHPDKALHHHGDDPSEAGYTIEELFILSRSAVQRQREIALLTLVHMTQRARHRLYADYLQAPLLPQLLDSGIVQLFRHGLDGAEYEIALQGLVALLVSPVEVMLQDYLWRGTMYTLQPEGQIEKDMEHDEVLKCDAVRVLIDSNIAQRAWYLLTKCSLTPSLLHNLLSLLLHLAQHSLYAATLIVRHAMLMGVVVKCCLPADLNHFIGCDAPLCTKGHPNAKAVALVRVMCMSGVNNAKHILSTFDLEDLITAYISLPQRELASTELVQCQVEMVRMWGVLLRYSLCTSVYTQLYSILVKELHLGGQRSVRLTTALLDALSTGLSVLPWSEVGCLYQAVCGNVRSWPSVPPSGAQLPPSDDLMLYAAVLRFISVYTELHYKKHCDLTLIDEVSRIMDSVMRPLVTGPLFEALSQHVQYTSVCSERGLSVPSLPTLGLHMYHEYQPGSPLDFTSLSPEGEKVCSLHAACLLLSSSLCLISTCCHVNKELVPLALSVTQREGVTALLHVTKPLPVLLQHSLLELQHQLLKLHNKVNSRGVSVTKCALRVFSTLHPGYEHWQHSLLMQLINEPLLRSYYIHLFEAAVTRERISRCEEIEKGSPSGLLLGKFVVRSKLQAPWLLLAPSQMSTMTDNKVVAYLQFVLHCEENRLMCDVPVVVRLIRVMEVILLPSQPFLTPAISSLLNSLLQLFSSYSINFSLSSLSSHPSFYDFYLKFCSMYQADSFGDPVYAGYLLLPTSADYAVIYRRLLWLEQPEVLSSLPSSALPLQTILQAPETCPDMLSLYATALVSGLRGLPYKIALHQVAHYWNVYTDQKGKTHLDPKQDGPLRRHLLGTLNKSEEVKDLVLRYKCVKGNEVEFYDVVPKGRFLGAIMCYPSNE